MRTKLPRPTIRPATRADLETFYRKKDIAHTTRAMVGLIRGRIVACGGVAYMDGMAFAFFDLKPSARRYKVSIVKAARAIIDEVRAGGCKILYANVDRSEAGAERWLLSLDFVPTDRAGIWMWKSQI